METQGIWSESVIMSSYMVDKDLETNWVTIGNLFQEAAGNHAIFNGLGYYDMKAQNMMWVLNRFKIQILRFPQWRETVTVKTWVSSIQPFSNRHTILLDEKGNEIAYGSALWIPIDFQTHRPKRLTLPDNFILIPQNTPCGVPDKLPDWAEWDKENIRHVQYKDIDFLNHVNNVQYISWILDDIYLQKGKQAHKSLEINYINECSAQDSVKILSKMTGNTCFYLLKRMSDDKEICKARLIYN